MSGKIGHRGLLLRGGATSAEAAAIYSSLVAWWSLNENAASPTYADSHGTNNLTVRQGASTINTSTVSGAAGKKGRFFNCANVDDRTAYIPRSNTTLDLPNANFTFGGWIRPAQPIPATAAFVIGRVGSNTSNLQAYIGIENDTNLRAYATSDGTLATRVGTAGFSTSVWAAVEFSLIAITLNRTANLVEIRLRRPGFSGGALQKQTVAFPSALYTAANNSNFTISEGLSSDSTFFSLNRSGIAEADECFYALRAVTDAEFGYLYNAGAGKSYAELKTDAGF